MKNRFGYLSIGNYFYCPKFGICIKTNRDLIADSDQSAPESKNAFAIESQTPIFMCNQRLVFYINSQDLVSIGACGEHLWVPVYNADNGGFGPFEIKKMKNLSLGWDFIPVRSGLHFGESSTPVTALLLADAWTFINHHSLHAK